MIAILDIGKTNKKCFVFDEDYQIVFERSNTLPETTDEDGEPCEDLNGLKNWVLEVIGEVLNDPRFSIRAINVSAYGASLVHVDAAGQPLTPLYNYLRPFPENLKKRFFEAYGQESQIALETASPILGNLNSGLQLYWLQHQKPLIFKQIKWSLHLPQYIMSLITAQFNGKSAQNYTSEITSIGCHTLLWDFRKNDYHSWVKSEKIEEKLPPLIPSHAAQPIANYQIGAGLHDSSAALIPYLACFREPFVLLSTGTWCISLNPFNHEPLTAGELAQDCLCYLSYSGRPVKAARYFGGNQHEEFTEGLAQAFDKPLHYYQQIRLDRSILDQHYQPGKPRENGAQPFENYETGYHLLMVQIIRHQCRSTKLVLNETTKRIFVDGGFSKNELYMQLLADAFPTIEVFAAEVAQATALGAALVIHDCWNAKPPPQNLIVLKKYTASRA